MESFALHLYVGAVFDAVSEANRYFANAEPWRLAKSDPARMGLVLFVTAETLRIAAILLQPVMPSSMSKLLDLLGVPGDERSFTALDAGKAAGRLDAPHRLKPGRALPTPEPIFPRYVEQPEGAK
jgi:methionyl-tRNA synthetase